MRLPALALIPALAALLPACSSNLSRFDLINTLGIGGKKQVSRAETADQGSGRAANVAGSSGHTLERVTVGGSYARRIDATSPSSSLSAGLHAPPDPAR
jgi:hypothetical protein